MLLFDAEEFFRLRTHRCPVASVPIGTLPTATQQSAQLGKPFLLTDHQAAFARGDVLTQASPCRVVFYDLSQRGLHVTPAGPNYGVDFVAYEGDPLRFHGFFLVKVLDKEILPTDIVRWTRVAASVKKQVVLARVNADKCTYTALRVTTDTFEWR